MQSTEKLKNKEKRLMLGNSFDIKAIMKSASENDDLQYFLEGDMSKRIDGIAPIDLATPDDLSFCSYDGDKALQLISNSQAGIILCRNSVKDAAHPRRELQQQLVFLDNPRLAFVHFVNTALEKIRHNNATASKDSSVYHASPTAIISPDAEIGRNCQIGNFVVIGKNCKIGDNTSIHDRVILVQNCTIGSNCIIQSGATIGEDGFAYERYTSSQKLEHFPHFGGVIIGNNVEVAANCSIARGSLSDTIIGDGTKIDGLVHIAHNVQIGRNCQLTAGTVIGGSTVLGDSCWTGLNCTIKNKIKIGNNVLVGAGACVIKDVIDGDVVAGVPAKSIKTKVSTDETFLMAGQKESTRSTEDSGAR